MADIAALQAKRGRLAEQIALSEAAKQRAESSAARYQRIAQSSKNPKVRDEYESLSEEALGEAQLQAAKITRLTGELQTVDTQIAQAQSQQGAQVSSGQTVKRSQTARDDGASATNPPPENLKVDANGRISKSTDSIPTNAEKFVPEQGDTGTNGVTRKASNLQSTPAVVARPGAARNPVNANVEDAPLPTNQAGAATPGDDAAGTGVRARLNNLFGGINNRIIPQANILDNYASYTYNISIYLMNPDDYKKMLKSKQKRLYGAQLLMQSGGAPVTGVSNQTGGQTDPGEIPGVTTQSLGLNVTGRNQFFPLDYYIDDVEVRSIISGKGTNGAHNVTELKFKVIENNGITFLDNLFAATQQYIKVTGGDVNKNYAAQNFLMVIRFYGYDENGNLVTVGKTGQDAAGTDINAIVEKFIPFQFTGIKFRIANKLVEYDCSAVCPQNNVNTGASRGVIPYNVELQSQTLKDLLTGTQQFAAATQTEGRVTAVANNTAAGARTPTNVQGLGMLSDVQGA